MSDTSFASVRQNAGRSALPETRLQPLGCDIENAPAAPLDAQTVIDRLEEAGRTLLALPHTGYSTRLRLNAIEFVRGALAGDGGGTGGADAGRLRPATPDSASITRMDEALGWIPLIPIDKYVLRRVVGCRALVSPLTDRHLFSWRRIGTLLGADHKAIQRWHAQGIDLIVAALLGPRNRR